MILPDANLLVAFTWEFATLEEALAKRFPEVSEWVK